MLVLLEFGAALQPHLNQTTCVRKQVFQSESLPSKKGGGEVGGEPCLTGWVVEALATH
jgi:hypothetical protein